MAHRNSMRLAMTCCVGGTWLVLGLLKVPAFFDETTAINPIMVSAMALECLVGLAVLVPRSREGALIASITLSGCLFVGNLFPNPIARAFDEECGCFGPSVSVQRSERRASAGLLFLATWLSLSRSSLLRSPRENIKEVKS